MPRSRRKTVADLGCGVGPLLPALARRFNRVIAVDFAPGMLERARERCADLTNVEFHQLELTDLSTLEGSLDVAVAVNSLVLPDPERLETALKAIHAALRPRGRFLGIVPAIDSIHYFTMLLSDRARQAGLTVAQARAHAAKHAEHELYDFAVGDFHFRGLEQHFWNPFEVRHRLRQAGFRKVALRKVRLAWQQFGCARELADFAPPWDWFFSARR